MSTNTYIHKSSNETTNDSINTIIRRNIINIKDIKIIVVKVLVA